jgi:hypothetical protein
MQVASSWTEMLTGQHPLAPGRRSMPPSTLRNCLENASRQTRTIDIDPRAISSGRSNGKWRMRTRSPQSVTPAARATSPARWWWEFHQAAVSIVYAVMVWPTWLARNVIGGQEGNAVFVTVLAAAIVAVTLRLHLWFTSRFYSAELGWARSRATGVDARFGRNFRNRARHCGASSSAMRARRSP